MSFCKWMLRSVAIPVKIISRLMLKLLLLPLKLVFLPIKLTFIFMCLILLPIGLLLLPLRKHKHTWWKNLLRG